MNEFLRPRDQSELPTLPPRPESEGFWRTLGAGFQQENDIVALYNTLTRQAFPPDPGFNITEALEGSEYALDHFRLLARAQSRAEFAQIEGRIRQETRQREILASAGFGGFAAGMGGALFSPTMLIPLAGQARGLRGVGQSFALAAGAATAQEVALFADQLTRTEAETFGGIAAGTVLGGLLGSAAVYLRRPDFDRIARDMAGLTDEAAISQLVRGPDGSYTRTGSTPVLRTDMEMRPIDLPVGPVTTLPRVTPQEGVFYVNVPRAQAQAMQVDGLDFTQFQGVGRSTSTPQPPQPGELVLRVDRGQVENVSARIPPERIAVADGTEFKPIVRQEHVEPPSAPARESGSTVGAKAADEAPHYIPQRQADGTVRDVLAVPEKGWDELSDMDPIGVGKLAGQASPIFRFMTQKVSPALRRATGKLSTGGMRTKGSQDGFAIAPGGDAESRINSMIEKWQYRVMKAMRDAYAAHIYNGNPTGLQRSLGYRWAILTNRAPIPGKLTWRQFNEEASRALNTGDKTDLTELRPALAEARTMVRELKEYADEVMPGLIPDQVLREGETYFPHIYDPRVVGQFSDEFQDLVARHIEEKLNQAATARLERIREAQARDMEWIEVMQMERAAAEQTRDELLVRIRDLDVRRRNNKALDRALELEEEARDLVRARFEELEENYNAARDPAQTKANRRQAREELEDQYEARREEARSIRQALPEGDVDDLKELKSARRQLRMVNASVGRLQGQRAEALASLERLEQQNLDALQRLTDQAQRLRARMDRADAKFAPEELQKLEARFDRIAAQVEKAEARIEKLSRDVGTEFEPSEKISIASSQQEARQARLERVLDQAASFEDRAAAARQALDEKMQAVLEYTNRVNNRRAGRMERLRQRLDDLNPENVAREIEGINQARGARHRGFQEWLNERGSRGTFVDDVEAEFSFEGAARDAATQIHNSIMSANGRFSQFDMLDSIPGFRKHRMLDIPYEQKSKFLLNDVESISDRYLRSVVPDIELTRMFGSKNFQDIWEPIARDLDDYASYLQTRTTDAKGKSITPEQRAKQTADFANIRQSWANQFSALIDRLRNVRGMPEDPNDIGYRAGRFMLNWNVATMMGPAAITSIPDAGRGVMAYGLGTVFRESWRPFVRGFADADAAQLTAHVKRELRGIGVGVESYSQARATAMLDIFETYGAQTRLESGAEWLAKMTPKIALFGPQTDLNKWLTGRVSMNKFISSMQDVMSGTATAEQRAMLADNGLDANYVRRIWAELQSEQGGTRYQTPDGEILLPNVESWRDMEAVRAWSAAMKRESDRIIIRPGLERALWSDGSILGRMLFQFRSFTMAANSKMLMSGLQQRDMALFNIVQGTMFSLALGATSYYIWAMTAGERQREEMRNASWQHWMDQALYRSGLLGIFSEAQAIGSSIPATRPFTTFANDDLPGRRASSIMGAILGPSFGKIEDIAGVLAGIDEPTQGTLNTARKLLPYQNVFYLRQGLDAVQEGAGTWIGLPERRESR